MGDSVTHPVVLKGAEGLLTLGIKTPDRDAELGPGLEDPHPGNPERQVFSIRPVHEPVKDRIFKDLPPVFVFGWVCLYPRIAGFQPGRGNRGFRLTEIRTHLGTS